MSYVLSVVVADTSSMQNLAIAFAFTSSPYIATTFAGSAAAQSFFKTSGFRWGFGVFAIITSVISLPIFWTVVDPQKQGKEVRSSYKGI